MYKCVFFFSEKYQKESQRLRDTFVKRNERIQGIVGDVLRATNRDVSACSPDNYLYGRYWVERGRGVGGRGGGR